LNLESISLYILALYGAPSGNFNTFLKNLDSALHSLHTPSTHFIICGDSNINYLLEIPHKKQIENLLFTYNLTGIVNFPTRISHTSTSALDNIFIDLSCYEDYHISPVINDLSDHDAQILTLRIPVPKRADGSKFTRKVNKHTILDFIYKLSFESWDSVFNNNDVNLMFNSFLSTYLRIFYSSFPLIRAKHSNYKNNWITLGIITSCKRKRELFLSIRINNNPTMRNYYKKYC